MILIVNYRELPYGTMADEEMKKLDIPSLQDDGYIFLWVTGRGRFFLIYHTIY